MSAKGKEPWASSIWSVALSGNTLAVRSYYDNSGIYGGSVYFYDLVNSNAETKISASDGAPSDHFGSRLSLSGNTLAVGTVRTNLKGFVEVYVP